MIEHKKITPKIVRELLAREHHLQWDVEFRVQVRLADRAGDVGAATISVRVTAPTWSQATGQVERFLQILADGSYLTEDGVLDAVNSARLAAEYDG